jgi:hypothetical protein
MVGSGNFQFSPTGQFLKGTPMVPHGYFGDLDAGSVERYGARSDGRPIVANAGCRWWSCDAEYQYKSPGVGTSSGFEDTTEMVQDVSLNFKWNVTDTIHTNFDMQYVDAKYDNFHKDMSLDTYAAPTIDISGKEVELTFGAPHNINMTDAPEGIFSSRNNYTPGAINVRLNDSFGHEFATRADVIFDVDNGYIQKVKTGIRYSSRFQDVKATSQWSNMTADWQSPAQWVTLDTPAHTFTREENGVTKTYDFKGYPQSDFYTAKWSNKWGKMNTQDGFNTMVFADTHAMRNWENTFTSTALGLPRIGNYNMCDPLRNGENNPLVSGTCFATPDMLQVT